jgi:hypothetical protein
MKPTLAVTGIGSLSEAIVNKLLDDGLANSTFRDLHPEAYKILLTYREDMVTDVTKVVTNAFNGKVVQLDIDLAWRGEVVQLNTELTFAVK